MSLPLKGVRILAITQFGAGPYGTLMSADLGAEVINIEDPSSGGDVSRRVPPYQIEDDSLYFQSLNRNKRSLLLNLKAPEGKAIFHRLVNISDAVLNNLRGDVPERLGLTYKALREHNPAIVCCSLSAFGTTGPQAALPGYDPLAQASEGYMSVTGSPNEAPSKCGISVIDFAGGLTAALGLIAGIFAARKSGIGCDVNVNLRGTAMSMLNYLAIWYLNRGLVPKRLADSAHSTLVPCQTFPTRDGYLAIFCAKPKFWQQLCKGLERPDLFSDPRFANFERRFENKKILIPILERIFAKQTTMDWLQVLKGKIPCAPVRSIAEALDDPALACDEMIVEVSHAVYGKLREVGCPIQVSGTSIQYHAAPALGQDTEEILSTYLGLTSKEIENLRARGIVQGGAEPITA